MKAKYANLVTAQIVKLSHDVSNKISPTTRYLNTIAYPKISEAMWTGKNAVNLVSSRLTQEIITKLREEGYAVKRNLADEGSLFLSIEWGMQQIYNDKGHAVMVSPAEYNTWMDKITERLDVELADKKQYIQPQTYDY